MPPHYHLQRNSAFAVTFVYFQGRDTPRRTGSECDEVFQEAGRFKWPRTHPEDTMYHTVCANLFLQQLRNSKKSIQLAVHFGHNIWKLIIPLKWKQNLWHFNIGTEFMCLFYKLASEVFSFYGFYDSISLKNINSFGDDDVERASWPHLFLGRPLHWHMYSVELSVSGWGTVIAHWRVHKI